MSIVSDVDEAQWVCLFICFANYEMITAGMSTELGGLRNS